MLNDHACRSMINRHITLNDRPCRNVIICQITLNDHAFKSRLSHHCRGPPPPTDPPPSGPARSYGFRCQWLRDQQVLPLSSRWSPRVHHAQTSQPCSLILPSRKVPSRVVRTLRVQPQSQHRHISKVQELSCWCNFGINLSLMWLGKQRTFASVLLRDLLADVIRQGVWGHKKR